MQTRLQDIAEQLNLSTATISRALNKETENLVKKETRDRIFEFIRETGYKPNIKARELAKGKLTNFFLLSSQMNENSIFYDHYFINLIRGITGVLVDTEYSLVMLPIENDYTEDRIYKILLDNETAGLILSPYCSHLEFPFDVIKEYNFPVVSLDNEIMGQNAYNVLLDHTEAGYIGAKRLTEKGYKNILLVSDSRHAMDAELRRKGFFDFFRDNTDAARKIINIELPLSYISSEPVLEKILELDIFPIGVFALSDEIAVGLINRLGNKGLRCPEDVGVIGFDGLSIGYHSVPRLNSVAFPYQEVGREAALTIKDALEGKNVKRRKVIGALLTEGGSC